MNDATLPLSLLEVHGANPVFLTEKGNIAKFFLHCNVQLISDKVK